MYSCIHCEKSFISKLSLAGHTRMHGTSKGKLDNNPMCCCLITRKIISAPTLERFQRNIKYCLECNTPLDTNRKFCNHSCSGHYSNRQRCNRGWTPSEQQITNAKEFGKIRSVLSNKLIVGPYSIVRFYTCTVCNQQHIDKSKQIRKTCESCQPVIRKFRSKFKFDFNIKDYPDLFDIDEIEQVGWFSPRSQTNRNLDGLSRDHIISISDAVVNSYDPYYIKHPLNCKIIRQRENSSKNKKSDMTYDQLKKLVDEYELRSKDWTRTSKTFRKTD